LAEILLPFVNHLVGPLLTLRHRELNLPRAIPLSFPYANRCILIDRRNRWLRLRQDHHQQGRYKLEPEPRGNSFHFIWLFKNVLIRKSDRMPEGHVFATFDWRQFLRYNINVFRVLDTRSGSRFKTKELKYAAG
jgi:hypothetical protein